MAIPKNNTSAEERKDFTRTGDLSPASDETRTNEDGDLDTREVTYNAEEVDEDVDEETLEDDLDEDDLEDADEDVDEDVDEDIS